MTNKINVSMISNEKFIVLKLQYREEFVNIRQKVRDSKIKFPIKLFLRGFYRLFKKRYSRYRETFGYRMAEGYMNLWF